LLVVAPKLGVAGGLPAGPLAICLVGMLSITLGTIWQKRTAATVDLRTNAVVQFIGATCVVLPVAVLTEQGRLEPRPELFIGLFWSVCALSIGAIALLLALIRRRAVAGVAALLYLVPPVSALLAYPLFGETLSLVQIVGMGLAAVGVGTASR
jgi:drug/metabolite transporter (DMT)-like permease